MSAKERRVPIVFGVFLVIATEWTNGINVGVGIADVTGPVVGVGMVIASICIFALKRAY